MIVRSLAPASFPAMIEFGEHQSMKRIVHRGCDFRGNDAMSLSVDEQNARGGIKLAQIFGYAQLPAAPRCGIHFRFPACSPASS
jgi:hypothetical protein